MWVYFYPNGWQFPGLDSIDQNQPIPMQIVNNGTMNNGTGTYPYTDLWDFFLVIPAAPDASEFNPTTLGCTLAPTTLTSTASTASTATSSSSSIIGVSLSEGEIALVIIVVIVVALLAAGVIIFGIYYKRTHPRFGQL